MQKYKKSLKIVTFTLFATCMLFTSCRTHVAKPQISKLSFGQSFGMCVGYCYKEFIFENVQLVFLQIDRQIKQPYKVTENTLIPALVPIFDKISKDKFLQLKERYGCPDCSDGGSEWLEITFNDGKTMKVTFEFGETLQGMEDILLELRKLRALLINKYQNNEGL